jgi:hypothetical protein
MTERLTAEEALHCIRLKTPAPVHDLHDWQQWFDTVKAALADRAALERRVAELTEAYDILRHELSRVRELTGEPDYEISGQVLAAAKALAGEQK